ncbi:hypothetical protein WKI71_26535 [Streptomyces sp. MS1.AVA.1]|uniref:Uncharacterized protein n=1 Tax=Streptomyces machairae TaxID=3134109 RepID=A0ABU8UP43_9ACTN
MSTSGTTVPATGRSTVRSGVAATARGGWWGFLGSTVNAVFGYVLVTLVTRGLGRTGPELCSPASLPSPSCATPASWAPTPGWCASSPATWPSPAAARWAHCCAARSCQEPWRAPRPPHCSSCRPARPPRCCRVSRRGTR